MEEKVLHLLRLRGPMLPADVAKQLKTDSFFAGAQLSDLVEKKRVLISSIRIGSSPLYYIKEQKNRLEEFSKHMNDKDKKAFDMLKQKKVMRDRAQQPIIRVALRTIKDFAIPLNVTIKGQTEIFWKWYAVRDEEANGMIRKILEPKPEVKKEVPKVEPIKDVVEPKPKVEVKRPEVKEDKLKPEVKSEVKKEESKDIKKEPSKEKKKLDEFQEELKKELVEEPKTDFYEKIKKHFMDKSILLEDLEPTKKKTEYNMTIKIPSAAGNLAYYCTAKDKKRVNEGDLSSTIMKAQSKRLPAMFLMTGDLTKKAEKALKEELKDQINILKI